MRLSGLVVTAFLLVSATLFAQHTSGVSGSSASSASASSASSSSPSSSSSSSATSSHESSSSSSVSSSSSSNSGASHSSYSGGSNSSSSASSASSHNSGGSASHIANVDAGASHTNAQSSRSNSERVVREPNPEPNRQTLSETWKLGPPPTTKLSPTHASAPPEKKSFFSRLRHPFKPKPVRTADFKRSPPCRKEPCACPPGESRNGKGVCAGTVVSNLCEPGQYWNGGACAGTLACQPGNFWNGTTCVQEADRCATYSSRAALLASGLRSIKDEMDRACTQDPNGQQCRELTLQHEGELLRYRMLLNEAPVSCRVMLPDPLSL
jgi:hypothetical protein